MLICIWSSRTLHAQEQSGWQDKTSSFSAYAVAGLGAHLNMSMNYLKTGEKIFYGYTAGVSVMALNGLTFGPHLSFDMMFGKKQHHLDIRLGGVLSLDSYVTYTSFVPLLSLAYRYQKPDGRGFFRAGINSGGIGIGGGIVLKRS